MIDITLTECAVNTKEFKAFDQKLPTLFLGFAIKNEYDNQRLEICEKHKPKKRLFIFENNKKDLEEFSVLPLYGLFLELSQQGKTIAKTLLTEELAGNMHIDRYEKILAEYNLSCNDSYSYLNKRIYPIDFTHFKELTDNSLRDDNKILQHLLNLNEHKFDFQKFGSFKLLILV
mgnify:FL=1|tara:strand:+ start:46 stop:567 length:522 start_codon:yes stop_codon:yes gene_type:complete